VKGGELGAAADRQAERVLREAAIATAERRADGALRRWIASDALRSFCGTLSPAGISRVRQRRRLERPQVKALSPMAARTQRRVRSRSSARRWPQDDAAGHVRAASYRRRDRLPPCAANR
jgi:hypothetical protein